MEKNDVDGKKGEYFPRLYLNIKKIFFWIAFKNI